MNPPGTASRGAWGDGAAPVRKNNTKGLSRGSRCVYPTAYRRGDRAGDRLVPVGPPPDARPVRAEVGGETDEPVLVAVELDGGVLEFNGRHSASRFAGVGHFACHFEWSVRSR